MMNVRLFVYTLHIHILKMKINSFFYLIKTNKTQTHDLTFTPLLLEIMIQNCRHEHAKAMNALRQ